MKVGIVGSGNIGGNIGRQLAKRGHDVIFSYSRDRAKLEEFANEAGGRAGDPREAVEHAELVVLSVPWALIDEVLETVGSLEGKIVVDTTNQFTRSGLERLPDGMTAMAVNQRRMPGARYTKAFNTLTAGFQAATAGRQGEDRIAMFLAGDEADAKAILARLINEMGYEPADVGGSTEVWIMEAPRRTGTVYGEEYRPSAARRIVEAIRRDPGEASRLAAELRVPE